MNLVEILKDYPKGTTEKAPEYYRYWEIMG